MDHPFHHILFGGPWGSRWAVDGPLFATYFVRPFIWQDSARTTLAADTNPVGSLDDYWSGNGRHLSAAGAARPTLALSGGFYSLTLDGSDDALSRSGLSYGANNLTFCAVASLSANGSFPVLLSNDTGSELRCNAATRQPEIVGGVTSATSPTALTIGQPAVITGRMSLATFDIRVNGVIKASVGGTTINAAAVLNLGQRNGGSLFWPGSVYAAVVATAFLDDTRALWLERCLGRAAGLAI